LILTVTGSFVMFREPAENISTLREVET